jgi:hypothetical protein
VTVVWDAAPFSLVEIDWRFTDACCLQHQAHDGGSKHFRNVGVTTRLHGAASQDSSTLIPASVRTPDLNSAFHHRVYLRGLYNSQNKHQSFPWTAFTSWSL